MPVPVEGVDLPLFAMEVCFWLDLIIKCLVSVRSLLSFLWSKVIISAPL